MLRENWKIIVCCFAMCTLAFIGSALLCRDKEALYINFSKDAQGVIATPSAEEISEDTAADATHAPSESQASVKINLNTADAKELDSLEGIGPAIAERIIKYRQQSPFKTIHDLKKVDGIGEKRFAKLQDFITVEN